MPQTSSHCAAAAHAEADDDVIFVDERSVIETEEVILEDGDETTAEAGPVAGEDSTGAARPTDLQGNILVVPQDVESTLDEKALSILVF